MQEICDALQNGGITALKSLLVDRPELVETRDSFGDLPLHVACSARYESVEALHSFAVLQLLAESYPNALRIRNGSGMLPLHLSCWFGNNEQVHALAQWYPGALAEADDSGYQPLSFIIAKMAMSGGQWDEYQELVEFLLRTCPDSLWQVDQQGVLPLQCACYSRDGLETMSSDIGLRLLRLYNHITAKEGGLRKAVHTVNISSGETQQQLPIQVAVTSETRLEVVQMIHQVDPEAIRLPDSEGRLPLHYIMMAEFHSRHLRLLRQKVAWLVQVHPNAVAHPDQYGKTPLHYLLENESLMVQENEEKDIPPSPLASLFPLGSNSIPMDVVGNGSDNAAFFPPDSSNLLYHLLTAGRTTSQSDRNEWMLWAVQSLLSCAPNNPCAIPDLSQGNLPLHLAVTHHRHDNSARGLVHGLLQHYPGAILHANKNGHTALQLLMAGSASSTSSSPHGLTLPPNSSHCSLDIIFALVNHNPTSVL